jgi:hypothetical protein
MFSNIKLVTFDYYVCNTDLSMISHRNLLLIDISKNSNISKTLKFYAIL